MRQIYLCRHGETEWTVSGRHTGKTEIPLTQKGREQAVLLRKWIQWVPFDQVFSSPRARALETCGGFPSVEIDPNLAEWDYGDYEGLTTREIQEQDPSWNVFLKGGPHGESPAQVGQRADRFLEKISSYKGKVAVFSHGHFLRVLTARFLKLAPEMGKLFLLSVASLGILGYERDQPVIVLWNEIPRIF